MAGQDTASVSDILKRYYEGGIRELIPQDVKALKKFEDRDASEWGGDGVHYPIRIGRNQGVGYTAEMGSIPPAGRQRYAKVEIPMRFMHGRGQFSTQAMKASQGAKAAFAPVMEQEMDGLIRDMSADRGRVIFGDGRGVLALVNGDPGTGTTVTVDSPGGFAGAINGSRFLNQDALITFVVPATGALVASADETVSAVPAAGTTFTASTAVAAAIADNDYVVRCNKVAVTDVSDTSYAKEAMGLAGLIDDGTYVATLHGVNRTTYPLFSSTVIATVGALSADVLQRGIDLAEQRGGGSIDTIIGHQSTRRAYMLLMDDGRRYMGTDLRSPDAGTKAAKGGTLTFGGIEFMTDKYAPYGTLFGCDTTSWRRYVEVAGEFMNEDGSILQRLGSGSTAQDGFEFIYRIWDNFHVEKPNTCFRLDGITTTVVVAHID